MNKRVLGSFSKTEVLDVEPVLHWCQEWFAAENGAEHGYSLT